MTDPFKQLLADMEAQDKKHLETINRIINKYGLRLDELFKKYEPDVPVMNKRSKAA